MKDRFIKCLPLPPITSGLIRPEREVRGERRVGSE